MTMVRSTWRRADGSVESTREWTLTAARERLAEPITSVLTAGGVTKIAITYEGGSTSEHEVVR